MQQYKSRVHVFTQCCNGDRAILNHVIKTLKINKNRDKYKERKLYCELKNEDTLFSSLHFQKMPYFWAPYPLSFRSLLEIPSKPKIHVQALQGWKPSEKHSHFFLAP